MLFDFGSLVGHWSFSQLDPGLWGGMYRQESKKPGEEWDEAQSTKALSVSLSPFGQRTKQFLGLNII